MVRLKGGQMREKLEKLLEEAGSREKVEKKRLPKVDEKFS